MSAFYREHITDGDSSGGTHKISYLNPNEVDTISSKSKYIINREHLSTITDDAFVHMQSQMPSTDANKIDEGEEEAYESIEFSSNFCKRLFYDPNGLIEDITNENTCLTCNTPKIMLSDHLSAVSPHAPLLDESVLYNYLDGVQIPKIFQHRLLSTFLNHNTQSKEVNTDSNTIYNAVESLKGANTTSPAPPLEVASDISHVTIPQMQPKIQKTQADTRAVYKAKCSFHNCLSSSGSYSRMLHDVLDDLLKSCINNPEFENIDYRITMLNDSSDLIPQMVLCLNHVQYLSLAFKRSNLQWQKYIEREDNTGLFLSRFLKGLGGKDFSYSNFDELYDEMDEYNKRVAQSNILAYIDS